MSITLPNHKSITRSSSRQNEDARDAGVGSSSGRTRSSTSSHRSERKKPGKTRHTLKGREIQKLNIIQEVPGELGIRICSEFTPLNIWKSVRPVCRSWNNLSRDKSIWRLFSGKTSEEIKTIEEKILGEQTSKTGRKKTNTKKKEQYVSPAEQFVREQYKECYTLGVNKKFELALKRDPDCSLEDIKANIPERALLNLGQRVRDLLDQVEQDYQLGYNHAFHNCDQLTRWYMAQEGQNLESLDFPDKRKLLIRLGITIRESSGNDKTDQEKMRLINQIISQRIAPLQNEIESKIRKACNAKINARHDKTMAKHAKTMAKLDEKDAKDKAKHKKKMAKLDKKIAKQRKDFKKKYGEKMYSYSSSSSSLSSPSSMSSLSSNSDLSSSSGSGDEKRSKHKVRSSSSTHTTRNTTQASSKDSDDSKDTAYKIGLQDLIRGYRTSPNQTTKELEKLVLSKNTRKEIIARGRSIQRKDEEPKTEPTKVKVPIVEKKKGQNLKSSDKKRSKSRQHDPKGKGKQKISDSSSSEESDKEIALKRKKK